MCTVFSSLLTVWCLNAARGDQRRRHSNRCCDCRWRKFPPSRTCLMLTHKNPTIRRRFNCRFHVLLLVFKTEFQLPNVNTFRLKIGIPDFHEIQHICEIHLPKHRNPEAYVKSTAWKLQIAIHARNLRPHKWRHQTDLTSMFTFGTWNSTLIEKPLLL